MIDFVPLAYALNQRAYYLERWWAQLPCRFLGHRVQRQYFADKDICNVWCDRCHTGLWP